MREAAALPGAEALLPLHCHRVLLAGRSVTSDRAFPIKLEHEPPRVCRAKVISYLGVSVASAGSGPQSVHAQHSAEGTTAEVLCSSKSPGRASRGTASVSGQRPSPGLKQGQSFAPLCRFCRQQCCPGVTPPGEEHLPFQSRAQQ